MKRILLCLLLACTALLICSCGDSDNEGGTVDTVAEEYYIDGAAVNPMQLGNA